MNSPRQQRLFVAWWGALELGGETIGDLDALCRVLRLLKPFFTDRIVLSRHAYREIEADATAILDVEAVRPHPRDLLVFVCGPIIGSSQAFRHLIRRFQSCHRMAIGVSLLPASSPDCWNPFTDVLARDGSDNCIGDLAFEPETASTIAEGPLGICLRGQQSEYGTHACMNARAKALTDMAISQLDREHALLDTRLRGQLDAAARIKREFASCSAVVSTRLHGLRLSLALNIPVFALDQIKGGAKVSQEAVRIGWPDAHLVESPDNENRIAEWVHRTTEPYRQLHTARKAMKANLQRADSRILQLVERAL